MTWDGGGDKLLLVASSGRGPEWTIYKELIATKGGTGVLTNQTCHSLHGNNEPSPRVLAVERGKA